MKTVLQEKSGFALPYREQGYFVPASAFMPVSVAVRRVACNHADSARVEPGPSDDIMRVPIRIGFDGPLRFRSRLTGFRSMEAGLSGCILP